MKAEHWRYTIPLRLRSLFRRRQAEKDLQDELQYHLDRKQEEAIEKGLTPEQARHEALRALTGVEQRKEECRDMRRVNYIEDFVGDVRYALRTLRKAPGYALTAALTLALGIGATTAIFSLVHEVMLRSLPVAKPNELWRVGDARHCCVWVGYTQQGEFSIFSYDLYKHLRDGTPGFAELAAFQSQDPILSLRRSGDKRAVGTAHSEFVSGNYFKTFGVPSWLGRALEPSDDRPGAAPIAMMSYRLWQNRYGSDPGIVGASFNINSKPVTIVGITPPGFFGDQLRNNPPDIWIPLAQEPLLKGESSFLEQKGAHWLYIIGRVVPGANLQTIAARLNVELQQWLQAHSAEAEAEERPQMPRQVIRLAPGGAGVANMRAVYAKGLLLLMAAAILVLLVACANIANLSLARGLARRRQTSVRLALGAPRTRLIRQVLTESIVLAALGGTMGIAVAYGGSQLLLHFAFAGENHVPIHAAPSWPVLLFALGATLLTGMAFGLVPAWAASHSDPIEALRGAGRTTGDASLPQRSFVVVQAALSLVLVSTAALLMETLRHLETQRYGFDTAGREVVDINPLLAGYKIEQLPALYREIETRLRQLGGVRDVSLSYVSPMSGNGMDESVYIAGRPEPPANSEISYSLNRVGPHFFTVMGTRILQGRAIDERDTASSPHVAMVTEAFVKRFFPHENPIGKYFGKSVASHAGDYRIVGVTEDTRYLLSDMDKPPAPMFFLPITQRVTYGNRESDSAEIQAQYLRFITLHLAPGVRSVEAQVRRALQEINPNLPIIGMQSLTDQVKANFTQQELIARLTSLFGGSALVLAIVGLYGVTAYGVARRTGEIGLRMALGASRGLVMALVMRRALALVGIGLLFGMPLTIAAGYLIRSQLYGVSGTDPLTLAGAALILAFGSALASALPARRAASTTPMSALRVE